jgi:hypothetical protein
MKPGDLDPILEQPGGGVVDAESGANKGRGNTFLFYLFSGINT